MKTVRATMGLPKEGYEDIPDGPMGLSRFKPGTIDELIIGHYVCREPNLPLFMEAIHGLLKPGGTCIVAAPYYTSIRVTQDPRNIRGLSECTFLFCNKEWRETNKLDLGITCDFDIAYAHLLDQEYLGRADMVKQQAVKNYWNAVMDIQITLTKK